MEFGAVNLLGTDTALVRAKHTVGGYTNVSAERFRSLAPNLYLAVGARVFINSNVWTAAGLANGAVGEIVHMPVSYTHLTLPTNREV